jgi:hypothetical protein
MKKIIWEVRYLSTIIAVRYCPKCAGKSEYFCTGLFRVNAQRKYLDIWLIYKCGNCDTTWNSTLYSRIHPRSISSKQLEKFYRNDRNLAEQYAMDGELLRKNGAAIRLPEYEVTGEEVHWDAPTELHIIGRKTYHLKVSKILRDKLSLSRTAFEQMVACRQIQSLSGNELTKCKLHDEILLLISNS